MQHRATQYRTGLLAALLSATASASPAQERAVTFDAVAVEAVTIEYIAHACFRLESADSRLVIDPFADQVWLGYDFLPDLEADAVLVTHPHYDHDAGDRIGRPSPWPAGVRTFRDPGGDDIGPFLVTGFEGRHADPYGKEFRQKNTIFVVEVAGLRIAHLGDNGPLTRQNIAELGRIDVLMLPIDGDQHILKNVEVEAILQGLRPRVVIPMHYRLPDLEPGDGPDDLGAIEPWLKGRPDVRRLDGNTAVLAVDLLPESQQVWVFQHHPGLTAPR